MAQLIAYFTTAALWLAIGIVVLWLFTFERRTHQRHKALADALRRSTDRRLP